MVKITWDKVTERLYEAGTSKGVLSVINSGGVNGPNEGWNGLIGVTVSPDGAEPNDLYANNGIYLTLRSKENTKGTIRAYMYPDGFAACDGSKEVIAGVHVKQQARSPFNLAWSTILGNDTKKEAYGETIHLVWNATASPSERAYETMNADPDAIELSWDFEAAAIGLDDAEFNDIQPTAYVTVKSVETSPAFLTWLKDTLYGTELAEPSFPSLEEFLRQAMLQTTPVVP